MDDVLTPAEAAAILRVSSKSVVKLCTSGQLGHFKVGKLYRIRRSALEAYMAAPAPESGPAPAQPPAHFGSDRVSGVAVLGAKPSTPVRKFPGLRGGRKRGVRGSGGAA